MKLKDFTKIPKVLGVGLVSDDGFIIEGQATYEYDTERLGAIAARVVNRIKNNLSVEGASAIIYTEDNVLFLKEVEAGIIFVICHKDANVGLIKIRLNKMT